MSSVPRRFLLMTNLVVLFPGAPALLLPALVRPRDPASITIYIGPDKPAGDKAKNWIPTVAGKAWFPYFRLYSPKQAFLDRTWILPDIEKAK